MHSSARFTRYPQRGSITMATTMTTQSIGAAIHTSGHAHGGHCRVWRHPGSVTRACFSHGKVEFFPVAYEIHTSPPSPVYGSYTLMDCDFEWPEGEIDTLTSHPWAGLFGHIWTPYVLVMYGWFTWMTFRSEWPCVQSPSGPCRDPARPSQMHGSYTLLEF